MKELFNIIPNSTGDGFRMKLSTGVIDVPDDNGGYIISSGCGSGKTESIKSLIRQKYNSGILYCVDTRDELGKMYDWILANLVNRELGYGDILRESDVMIISSDKERSSFLNQYRNNPEILMEKKIILITHVRFWTDLINYFLIYRPQVPVDSFDGDFKKLMVRPDLRRYILFDETPTFIRPFVEFDRTILGVFSKTDDTGNIICMSPEEITRYYNRFMRNTRNDLFNQAYKINRIKRDVVLNLIPKYYDSWMLDDNEKSGITFYPVDLCPLGVTIGTHILVFEGAGDILLRESKHFTLLDVGQKYNSVTEFKKMGFNLSRKEEFDENRFTDFIDAIAGVINKKTLIVCWKGINGENSVAGQSEYADKIKEALLKKGIAQELPYVTYYGSSDNKSTNEYRDIDQIILCGNWSLPNTEAAKIRRAYGTTTDPQKHKDWFFSQLITRIGIRKHQPGTYTVYYTEDFDDDFIERMKVYLNESRILKPYNKKQPDWKNRLDTMSIRGNLKNEIVLLAMDDENMRNAIGMDREYTKEVSFDYLENLGVKRYVRERRKYNKLIETLGKIKITLIIK